MIDDNRPLSAGTDDAAAIDVRQSSEEQPSTQPQAIYDVLKPLMDEIDSAMASGPQMATGYRDLDRMLIDVARHRLLVICGRAAIGKTSFLLNVLLNLARSQVPIGLLALRDSAHYYVLRILCIAARIDPWRLLQGTLTGAEYERLAGVIGEVGDLPITIVERPRVTLTDLETMMRSLKEESLIRLMAIDGYEGIRPLPDQCVPRDLESLGRDLHLPIAVVSSVSAAAERRMDKRPRLSDLSDHELALAADCILAIHREDNDSKSVEVSALKNRFGPRWTVTLQSDSPCGLVSDAPLSSRRAKSDQRR
jgi:replicative DNA helicase